METKTSQELRNTFTQPTNLTIDWQQKKIVSLTGEPVTEIKDLSFNGQDLTGFDFSGIHLTCVEFRGANLTGANFSSGTLWGCSFEEANLTNAIFPQAKMEGVDFANALLIKADLRNTQLDNTSFRAANLAFTDFSKAVINPNCSIEDSNLVNTNFSQTKYQLDPNYQENLKQIANLVKSYPDVIKMIHRGGYSLLYDLCKAFVCTDSLFTNLDLGLFPHVIVYTHLGFSAFDAIYLDDKQTTDFLIDIAD